MSRSSAQGIRRLIRGAHPEIRKLLLIADEQHYRIRPTTHRHFLVSAPRPGGHVTTVSSTPSDIRSIANARAQLRRIGVDFAQSRQKGRKAA